MKLLLLSEEDNGTLLEININITLLFTIISYLLSKLQTFNIPYKILVIFLIKNVYLFSLKFFFM